MVADEKVDEIVARERQKETLRDYYILEFCEHTEVVDTGANTFDTVIYEKDSFDETQLWGTTVTIEP